MILDIVVIAVILISSVVAFLRGFVREVLTILGFVGAVLASLTIGPKFLPGIEGWLVSDIPQDDLEGAKLWGVIPFDIAAAVLAYAGIFVVTLIVLSVISHFIAKSVHAIGLGPIDRSLGVVFGVLRGCVLIGLLYMPFHILMDEEDKKDWFSTSHSITYVETFSEIMMGLMPESWMRESGDSDEGKADKNLDPLKNLTGEEKAEQSSTQKTLEQDDPNSSDIESQAMDVLIKNKDQIKNIIDAIPEGKTGE